MKKKYWRRTVALFLSLCMVIGLYTGGGKLQELQAEETSAYTHWTFATAARQDEIVTSTGNAIERHGTATQNNQIVAIDGSIFSGYASFSDAHPETHNLNGYKFSQLLFGSDKTTYDAQSIKFTLKYSGDKTYLAFGTIPAGTPTLPYAYTFTTIPVSVDEQFFLTVTFDYINNDKGNTSNDLRMIVTAKGQTETVYVNNHVNDATTRRAYVGAYIPANQSVTLWSGYGIETSLIDEAIYYGKQKVLLSATMGEGAVTQDLKGITVDGEEVSYITTTDSAGKEIATFLLTPKGGKRTVVITNKADEKIVHQVDIRELEGRTAVTFRDLLGGLTNDGTISPVFNDATSTWGAHAQKGYHPMGFCNTVFSGYVTFARNSGMIKYGTEKNSEGNETGTFLQIYRDSESTLRIYNKLTEENKVIDTVPLDEEGTKEYFIQIVNTTVGDNLVEVSIYLEGKLIDTQRIAADDLGPGMVVQSGRKDGNIGAWRSLETIIELSARTYDLADGAEGYLLLEDGQLKVNGKPTEKGTALKEIGSYQIERTENGATYVRELTIVDTRDHAVQIPALSYEFLGGDEVMPIVGHHLPGEETNEDGTVIDFTTDKYYRLTKDSGINMINYTETSYATSGKEKVVLEQLRLAQKYNLGMYVFDGGLATFDTAEQWNERLSAYSGYESYLGNLIIDEPNSYLYYNTSKNAETGLYEKTDRPISSVANVSKYMNQYGNLTGFINLYPMVASLNDTLNLGTEKKELMDAYTDYAQEYVDSCNGKVISFDRYPSTADSSGTNKDGIMLNSAEFYQNLSIIRKVAEDSRLPFWTFIETGDYLNIGKNDLEKQIEREEILWYVNTALAYGSKGIEYYTVVEVDKSDALGADGASEHGMIDNHGNKTKWYAYVKEANEQIAAVDHVLMKSLNVGVIPVGTDSYVKNHVSSLTENIPESKYGNYGVASITTTGTNYGALAGVFEYYPDETKNESYHAFYIVNSDTTAKQMVTLTLQEQSTYSVIQDSVGTFYDAKTDQIKLSIPAGEGVLVVVGLDATEGLAKEDKQAFTVYYEDIAPYRVNTIRGVYENWAPTVTGYAFAGWFADEACTIAIDKTTVTGPAYAKYVDNKVMDVKTQLHMEQNAMRFVSTVDGPRYEKIGFDIQYNPGTLQENEVVYTTESMKAYSSESIEAYMRLYALLKDGSLDEYVPTDFSAKSIAFYAYTVNDIPENAKDVPFIVTAYWETLDGTRVSGDTVSYSVNEAIRLSSEAEE